MNLNKILKLALIIAVVIITVSVSYYYVIFLPKNKQSETELQKQEKEVQKQKELNTLKLQFIRECENKYDELEVEWQKKSQFMRDKIIEAQEKRCEIIKNTTDDDFDIEMWWYCWNGQLVFDTKESFTNRCVKWKFKQLEEISF
jgi:uncharacterized protein HemX